MSDDAKGFRLFLVGPMGSGKSTVGRHLAGLLDCPFIDSDAEIDGKPIRFRKCRFLVFCEEYNVEIVFYMTKGVENA